MSFLRITRRALDRVSKSINERLKAKCHDCKELEWVLNLKTWEGNRPMQQFRVCGQCFERRKRMLNDWENVPWEYYFLLINDFRMMR